MHKTIKEEINNFEKYFLQDCGDEFREYVNSLHGIPMNEMELKIINNSLNSKLYLWMEREHTYHYQFLKPKFNISVLGSVLAINFEYGIKI